MTQYSGMTLNYKKVQTQFQDAFANMKATQAGKEHTCSYPSCTDKVWRDHYCWDHYQHEYYTAR